jgi:hypothetical protein
MQSAIQSIFTGMPKWARQKHEAVSGLHQLDSSCSYRIGISHGGCTQQRPAIMHNGATKFTFGYPDEAGVEEAREEGSAEVGRVDGFLAFERHSVNASSPFFR